MMSKIHIKEIYLLRSPSTCMSLHKIFYEHHRWPPRRPTGLSTCLTTKEPPELCNLSQKPVSSPSLSPQLFFALGLNSTLGSG